MQESKRLALHYVVRGLILSGYSLAIIFAVQTNSLSLLTEPNMSVYVKISAIGLLMMGMYQGCMAFQSVTGVREACDCEHIPSNSWVKNVLIYTLFLLPLVMVFV
ncbi:hypothetical protein BVG16_02605 [Paenibacillus selenitireducens]|uniref:DUF1980 domain-containing protein n=1 Tax=Paenibacillus selenitireducens TaxID=1324314 RepID=A0A1T2XMX9_9BACL|nr:DUF1980 domain-containing protein [Paenibacillus selenitireducens]OPA81230.1 hypothetical protein BVG16_02605 [Paenibacillus selenitireducens]